MKAKPYITRHAVKHDGTQFPPGSEISLSDPSEIDRLLRLGAIVTFDQHERLTRVRGLGG